MELVAALEGRDPSPSITPAEAPGASTSFTQTQSSEQMPEEMVTVAGLACRFPGASNRHELWANLLKKEISITAVSPDRWDASEFVSAERAAGKTVTCMAGWLPHIDRFDFAYFKMSKKEALEMDPQQRMALEVATEALVDSGIELSDLHATRSAVYAGAGIAEFMGMSFSDPDNINPYTMTGNSLSVIANRISFVYNLSGPSMTVDTACSSASTAFHLACQALRTGECETAIVIGVGALLHVSPFVGFSQAHMISPTGTSRPFDARANGFVRGEGCGTMILRTRSSPVTVGVSYATVAGDGANEDGRTKSMTMPCGNAQLDVMDCVHKRFGIDADQVQYSTDLR